MRITRRDEDGFPTLKECVWLPLVGAPSEAEFVLDVSGQGLL